VKHWRCFVACIAVVVVVIVVVFVLVVTSSIDGTM
jgi:t-SNARE complex subunit (syntaxin)